MSTFIIAEAGVNHNGSFDLAHRLVEEAAAAKADAVKFQTYKTKNLASKNAQKADYQKTVTGSDTSQFEMLKTLELDFIAFKQLKTLCDSLRIEFLSTAFDLESLNFLKDEVGVSRLKISSGDLTNAPLLLEHAKSGLDIILSTGMATLGEIEQSLGVLAFGYLNSKEPPSREAFEQAFLSAEGDALLRKKVTLLHCTTEYPAPFREINLNAMISLKETFKMKVGYSDHTTGTHIPVAAAALGAEVIEKHFTLDKNLHGPDHIASLDPGELRKMISDIHDIEQAMGSGVKRPSPSEIRNRKVARRSLVALMPIQKGDLFKAENIGCKRPGNSASPINFWQIIGQVAPKDYLEDEAIELSLLPDAQSLNRT